jgi:membrane protein DedA with SNARE-associated domain
VEEFLREWSYLGIFLGIVATGVGFPMPEELPVVVGGALVGGQQANWWMLPVCIVGVIVGDGCLYTICRFWGPRLLKYRFVNTRLLPPERLEHIERNFQQYGVRILLFARLTPGIRAPIFLTAGLTRLPLSRFLLADGIYAIPGVSLLFLLGWYFGELVVDVIRDDFAKVKNVVIVVVVLAVVGYFVYRLLRRPVITGDPKEMPRLVEQVTHTLEQVSVKIMHPGKTAVAPPSAEPRTSPSGGSAALPDGRGSETGRGSESGKGSESERGSESKQAH